MAAASQEVCVRTLRYVEPLSPHRQLREACDARTPLADFFSIRLVRYNPGDSRIR